MGKMEEVTNNAPVRMREDEDVTTLASRGGFPSSPEQKARWRSAVEDEG